MTFDVALRVLPYPRPTVRPTPFWIHERHVRAAHKPQPGQPQQGFYSAVEAVYRYILQFCRRKVNDFRLGVLVWGEGELENFRLALLLANPNRTASQYTPDIFAGWFLSVSQSTNTPTWTLGIPTWD